jgi:hypothetical protein
MNSRVLLIGITVGILFSFLSLQGFAQQRIAVREQITEEGPKGQDIPVKTETHSIPLDQSPVQPNDEVEDVFEQVGRTPVGQTIDQLTENNPRVGLVRMERIDNGNRQDFSETNIQDPPKRAPLNPKDDQFTGVGVRANF